MEIKGSVCRTCLTRDEENIPLSSLVVPWKNKVEGKEMLEFLLGCTEIDDSEPFSEICNSCINILMVSYSFKLKCLASEEKIREYRKPLDVAFSLHLPNKEDFDGSEEDYSPNFDAQSLPEEPELVEDKKIQMEPIKQQNKLTAPTKKKDNSQKKRKICDICGKSLVDGQGLNFHKRTVHGERNILCALCDYSTKSKQCLRSHMKRHSKEKTLSCKYCNERFLYGSVRRYHIQTKHETHIDHKKFQCNICLKKFFRNPNLRRHMRSHTKERPYECKTCNLR